MNGRTLNVDRLIKMDFKKMLLRYKKWFFGLSLSDSIQVNLMSDDTYRIGINIYGIYRVLFRNTLDTTWEVVKAEIDKYEEEREIVRGA